jgi:hypothetical protein
MVPPRRDSGSIARLTRILGDAPDALYPLLALEFDSFLIALPRAAYNSVC